LKIKTSLIDNPQFASSLLVPAYGCGAPGEGNSAIVHDARTPKALAAAFYCFIYIIEDTFTLSRI
jgi:hypothetical protein